MQPSRGSRLILISLFTLLSGYLGWLLADWSFKLPWYTDYFDRFVKPPMVPVLKGALRIIFVSLSLVVGSIFASRAIRRVLRFSHTLEEMPPREKIAIVLGVLLGMSFTALLMFLFLWNMPGGALRVLLTLFSAIVVTYLCVSATMSMSNELWSLFPTARADGDLDAVMQSVKVLDTNVIIDGRIADICATGFLEGTLYVPGFILEELQHIADSSDSLKRARGRRGLEILNDMQKDTNLIVRDFDDVESLKGGEPVDQKLVLLAKHLNASVVTNDFNLNKVAGIQGVKVLNINELANAVKPVVLPGEAMVVQIIKEGKEPGQGVGYLEDGTMIVVEGGRRHIGEHLTVVVSSVLQTVAGKMIFTQIRDADEAPPMARVDRATRPLRSRQ